ncbi:hypothetical protein R1sor_005879 [Riccia sorocarpa]|uniref:Uncharacterized protein n=1 Tax=Riccia sorocarpa TaxID=122646 RepID=A0ABD3HLC1_9MARC
MRGGADTSTNNYVRCNMIPTGQRPPLAAIRRGGLSLRVEARMNRRVREDNVFRLDLTGMFFESKNWAWFNFPFGTVVHIPDLDEDAEEDIDVHELKRASIYLPHEFELPSDFVILRVNCRRTRLKGRITMPSDFRFKIVPENNVLYRVGPGEDFECSFLANGTLQFKFPPGSSLYVAD